MDCKFCNKETLTRTKNIPICSECKPKVKKIQEETNSRDDVMRATAPLSLKDAMIRLSEGVFDEKKD